ncbi:MAG: arsenite efflux transporter metallochaperone ArsD [Eubacteriaceae bacterium]
MSVEIYDPAMCCSTGVCGPGVDSELLRIAAIINAFEGEGKLIKRYNLSQEPQAYVDNQKVNDLLSKEGIEVLPITMVDGEVLQKGSYPSNTDLAAWLDMSGEEFINMMKKARGESCCGSKEGVEGCCGSASNEEISCCSEPKEKLEKMCGCGDRKENSCC